MKTFNDFDYQKTFKWQGLSSKFSDQYSSSGRSRLGLLCLFLVPFPVLGVQFSFLSIYASFLVASFDWPFWIKFLKKQKASKNLMYMLGFLFTWLLFSTLVFYQNSMALFSLLLKIGFALFYATYLFNYLIILGYQPVLYGLSVSVFLAVLQFLEANFLGTALLAPKNWITGINVSNLMIQFPLGADLGLSYAPEGVFNLVRVSGSALEPGYFSSSLFMLLPIVFLRNSIKYWIIWLVGLLCCYSKVTTVQIVIFSMTFLFILIRLSLLAKICIAVSPILAAIVGYFFVDANGGLLRFSELYSTSWLERVRGFYLFWEQPLWAKLFGTGLSGSCQFFTKEQLQIAENGESLLRTPSGSEICTVGVHSGLASLLLGMGIIGVLLLAMILFYFRTSHESKYVSSAFIISVACFVAGIQSIHFMTFYPANIFCFVLIICLKYKASIKSNEHIYKHSFSKVSKSAKIAGM